MMPPLLVTGVPGSPYTRKMLAVLRYRQLPYRFIGQDEAAAMLPAPKVRLMPTVYFPGADGAPSPVTDSTAIIERLDAMVDTRRVAPTLPGWAMLDAIIEDYADEWLTKAMFHFRWTGAADIRKAAFVIPNWLAGPLDDDALAAASHAFAERQIARLPYVGSNDVTAATIENSFLRFAELFDRHLSTFRFLMGDRPGAADFAIYGQMTQLALFDPTPMALIAQRAPRLVAWTMKMEDLSGLGDAPDTDPNTIAGLKSLLREIGHSYVPLLLANAAALETGAAIVDTQIDGRPWQQQPFPFHRKCLMRLRDHYANLAPLDREWVAKVLAGTGCDRLFDPLDIAPRQIG